MPDTSVQGAIPLTPEKAFEIYVNQIDTWWPRQGVFPYSFAPAQTSPGHIRFEPTPAGRFYEEFADGSEYVIGYITGWNLSESITYTWRDPTWKGEISISVSFVPIKDGTQITYEQSGFAAAGVPDLIPYYQIGNCQTLAGFLAHCQAIHELMELERANQ